MKIRIAKKIVKLRMTISRDGTTIFSRYVFAKVLKAKRTLLRYNGRKYINEINKQTYKELKALKAI